GGEPPRVWRGSSGSIHRLRRGYLPYRAVLPAPRRLRARADQRQPQRGHRHAACPEPRRSTGPCYRRRERQKRSKSVPRPPPPLVRAAIVGPTLFYTSRRGGESPRMPWAIESIAAATRQSPRYPTTNTRRRRWGTALEK